MQHHAAMSCRLKDMAAGAQHLLRRLFAAGVRDLETLKLRPEPSGRCVRQS